MREYQIRAKENYVLPRAVYNQCLWMVRDVNRLVRIVNSGADPALMPTAAAARERLEAIQAALSFVPEEYREGILDGIINRKNFGPAHDNTWKRWKQRFIYELAVNLMLV